MIIASPGNYLVNIDFSQAESWIVAYLANEPNMKRALNNGDIHAQTAIACFHPEKNYCEHSWEDRGKDKYCTSCDQLILYDERYLGKRTNHASAYRMMYLRMTQVINKDSDKPPYITVTNKQTKQMSENWHNYYNIKSWWAEIEYTLQTNNRKMITPYGRERQFFNHWGPELFKEATAFVPQSTVADHANGKVQKELGIEGGFLSVWKMIRKDFPRAMIINQSHDSILLDFPKEYRDELIPRAHGLLARPLIVNGEQFVIPVDCEIGEAWGSLEKFKI